MLHDEWRQTKEGQRVMAQLLLTGFLNRAYREGRVLVIPTSSAADRKKREKEAKKQKGLAWLAAQRPC